MAGTVTAIIAPAIGMFLVVRRYSLMADTLAHVSLLGIAISMLFKTNPVSAAIGTTILAAFGMEALRSRKRISGDAILALFLSGSLALAVIIIGLSKGFTVDLHSFLFGSILTVSPVDIYIISGFGILTLIMLAAFYKELFLVSFDETLANVSGISAGRFNLLLLILAALTVSLSIRIVGVLLIGALIVIPVITAMRLGYSFYKTLFIAMLFSIISVFLGLFLSFHFGIPSGGMIVIVALSFFLVSLFLKD